jgi:hypothetical protein
MKRRKTGRKTAKARVKASRRNAPKGARIRIAVGKDTATAQLARERDEALQQQAATAEILKLISSSPADTQPVFEAIVRNARRAKILDYRQARGAGAQDAKLLRHRAVDVGSGRREVVDCGRHRPHHIAVRDPQSSPAGAMGR